jgi:hypothetical protein
MGVAASRCSSEVSGPNGASPDVVGGAAAGATSPRLVVVEALAQAAVHALAGGDVVAARAAARALVEFIELLAGVGEGTGVVGAAR